MISTSSFAFLSMGAIFGLSAGLSPGPLLTLVITETLKHNKKEGIKIAVAPLITDLPIILTTFFIFSKISKFNIVLGLISFFGGIYFAWLGYETISTKGLNLEVNEIKKTSLKKGIVANFLNPNPYVFWLTAGIPTAWKAYDISLFTVIFYFLLFYIMLVGSKIGIALLVERSRAFFKNNIYRLTMRILGIILFIFALLFLNDAINIFRNLI